MGNLSKDEIIRLIEGVVYKVLKNYFGGNDKDSISNSILVRTFKTQKLQEEKFRQIDKKIEELKYEIEAMKSKQLKGVYKIWSEWGAWIIMATAMLIKLIDLLKN